MKKQKTKLKVTRLIVRVDADALAIIHKKAFVYAGGNMSLFLREAALNY